MESTEECLNHRVLIFLGSLVSVETGISLALIEITGKHLPEYRPPCPLHGDGCKIDACVLGITSFLQGGIFSSLFCLIWRGPIVSSPSRFSSNQFG
jgi:hypothetical protein